MFFVASVEISTDACAEFTITGNSAANSMPAKRNRVLMISPMPRQ
jgi:hypothetical protein